MTQTEKNYSADIKGSLDVVYKKFAIDVLYGLMEGDINFVVRLLRKRFELAKLPIPTIVAVEKDGKNSSGQWDRQMYITIIHDESEFMLCRDFSEESAMDRQHPDRFDDWFFESNDCACYKRKIKLYEQNNIER